MEYGLTQKQEIYLLLYQVIPSIDIIDLISNYKRQLEDQDNENYHTDKYHELFNQIRLSCKLEINIKYRIKYHEESLNTCKTRRYINMIGCYGFIHKKVRDKGRLVRKNASIQEKLFVCKRCDFSSMVQSYDEYMYDDGGGIELFNANNKIKYLIRVL